VASRIQEPIDLAELTRVLANRLPETPVGRVRGKTEIRNCAMELLGCSTLHAEEVVDMLEARGLIRFEREPAAIPENRGHWVFETQS
jgi:hypothetical protein